MNARNRRVGRECSADFAGLSLLETQPWIDVSVRQRGFCAGEYPDPLTDAQSLIKGLANPSKIDVTLRVHASTFGPEPSCGFGAQHVKRGLADLSLSVGIEQVVDGPEPGRGDPEAQHRGALAVGSGLGFVVNNLGLSWHKLPEFGDLFLEKGRLRCASRQGELDVTPAGTAIWDEAAVGQQQAQQSTDVCSVQFFTLRNLLIVRLRRRNECLLAHLSLGHFIPCGLTMTFRSC